MSSAGGILQFATLVRWLEASQADWVAISSLDGSSGQMQDPSYLGRHPIKSDQCARWCDWLRSCAARALLWRCPLIISRTWRPRSYLDNTFFVTEGSALCPPFFEGLFGFLEFVWGPK